MASNGDYRYSAGIDRHKKQPKDDLRNNPWDFENPWSHELCNCTEYCDETCYGLWCFPCLTCQLVWRMDESCWITCCIPGYLGILRTKMRTAFRIKVNRLFSYFLLAIFRF